MSQEVQVLPAEDCQRLMDSIWADRIFAKLASHGIAARTVPQQEQLLKLAFDVSDGLRTGKLQYVAPAAPVDPVLSKAASLLDTLLNRGQPAVDDVEKQAAAFVANPEVHNKLLSIHYHQAEYAKSQLAAAQ
jgi:hypothetical protein